MHLQRIAAAAFMCLALHSSPATAADSTAHRCKSYVQGRIDVLDAELHKGEKPDVARKLIKRRDKLRKQLAECDRNPDAYKKDL